MWNSCFQSLSRGEGGALEGSGQVPGGSWSQGVFRGATPDWVSCPQSRRLSSSHLCSVGNCRGDSSHLLEGGVCSGTTGSPFMALNLGPHSRKMELENHLGDSENHPLAKTVPRGCLTPGGRPSGGRGLGNSPRGAIQWDASPWPPRESWVCSVSTSPSRQGPGLCGGTRYCIQPRVTLGAPVLAPSLPALHLALCFPTHSLSL